MHIPVSFLILVLTMQFAALQDLLFQDRHLKEVVLHLGEGVIARVVVGVREGKVEVVVQLILGHAPSKPFPLTLPLKQ